MSSYKLTYFDITGRAEPIRFLLSFGGINFEDNRVSHDVWPQLKPLTPLKQLPILEIDDKTLYQSNSIIRYLAKKLDLNPSNDFEAFQVDATIETIGDLRQVLSEWYWNKDQKAKDAAKMEIFQKVAFYLGKLESSVANNGGYFVGGKLSAADIVFAGFSQFLKHLGGENLFADYPKLSGVIEKVLAQPSIKAYIAKRPKTNF